MLKSASYGILLFSLMLLALGCEKEDESSNNLPVNNQNVQQAIESATDAYVVQLAEALTFLNNTSLLQLIPAECEAVAVDVDFEEEGFEDNCGQIEVDFEESAEGLAEALNAEIFTENNIESQTETSITYRIPSGVLCETMGYSLAGSDMQDSPSLEEEDAQSMAECVDEADRFPVRLQVTRPGADQLSISLLVGEDLSSPVRFSLRENSSSSILDIGEIKSAAEDFTSTFDQEVDLPQMMDGQVQFELRRIGDQKFSMITSIPESIRILNVDMESPFALSLEATNSFSQVDIDGSAQKIVLSGDARALDFTVDTASLAGEDCYYESYQNENGEWVDGERCEPAGPLAGIAEVLDVHLAGMNYKVTLDGNDDTIRLENMGLGDETSTISVNDEQILAVDLNANSGRRFGATISMEEELVSIAVSPEFALDLAYNTPSDEEDQCSEPWANHDVIRMRLSGDSPTIAMHTSGNVEGMMQVVSGMLEMNSDNGPDVSIEAGMCVSGLLGEDEYTESPEEVSDENSCGAHPFDEISGVPCQ